MSEKIKVLVVDDHAIIRKGVIQLLRDTEDMEVVAEAQNGAEALQLIRDNPYDVVLLDISMPGEHGIDILIKIKDLKPNLPVLMLSMYPEDQYAIRSLKAGAAGYINKQDALSQMVIAIRQVSTGRKYISSELAVQLAENLTHQNHDLPHQTLSHREYQTLCLIASGKKLSEIAETMILSAKTVSVYRARLLEKMKMRTNAELIHYAITHHLVL
ncbi:MAG: response regulator [Ferrovum sp.]|jgi:DNA-binding NarL/FixJ family response regulator|uniref:response regulator n=1 Tax=Ferrovum sp. TaxID=2609467 RepID=UPI00262547DA|nr:response regulator transcription factor [Ferrovum sp.]MBW8065851.1 response regulator [Ferrovum sp.]